MGKMPRNEDRELLIESYEKTHNAEEIAKIFGVNKYTVYHMAERKRKTGSVALRTSQRAESSVNIDLTRRYGRAIGKTRVHGHAPLSTPRAQTILASVRLNGQTTHTTYTGGTTGQRFLEYLKDILIPTLHKGRDRGHGQYAVTPCQRSGGNASRRRHRAAVSAAVQPRYESD